MCFIHVTIYSPAHKVAEGGQYHAAPKIKDSVFILNCTLYLILHDNGGKAEEVEGNES